MSAQQKYVPAMATVSLKQVLELYKAGSGSSGGLNGGYSHLISRLSARGTQGDNGDPDLEEDVMGLRTWMANSSSRFDMEYTLRFDDDGFPENPLTEDRIRMVHRHLDAAGLSDAAVSKVSIIFYDEELGDRANVAGNKWHMTLESDPADSNKDRSEIDAHSENVPLIEEEGFKYHVLNVRRLIDRRQELMAESRTDQRPQFVWEGDTFDGIHNALPTATAVKLLNKDQMGKYGFGKRYGKDREDSIVLMGVESATGGG